MLFNELNNQNYQNIITEDPRTWSLFAGLTEGEYTELEQNVSIVHFAKDEVVFRPGIRRKRCTL